MKVVLVRPETPGNIGAVARAMKNFGLGDLVLVEPCDIDEDAYKRAKHAREVLDTAEVWDRMMWDEFDLTVSTSSETGGEYNLNRNAVSPCVLSDKLADIDGCVGLIFGPESKGLKNEEIKETDIFCHIPTDDCYPVLNLSHAVAVILYELSKADVESTYELASSKEREVLMDQLENIVGKVDVEEYRRESVVLSLKNIVGRSMISRKEASVLIGFFRKIKERL